MMNDAKFFIGPMSKNIVESIIDFCKKTNYCINFIPSRRQIEWDGGYVNNWTTKDFTKYVKSSTDKIKIERDHSGPDQGNINDNGYESLKEDCKYFDIIHIDPWKKYPSYSDGLKWTVDMIKFCDSVNPNLEYEIGTEQSIRKFEPEELDRFVFDLKYELQSDKLFNKIKYLVIQSGTSLKGNVQTGNYDKERLIEMLKVSKKHNLLSKEHNGDYIPISVIKEKFQLGLDSINIAPEFGLIETETYLNEIEKNNDKVSFEKFWEICFTSNKWKKWVNEDFNPYDSKKELIRVSGHYVISYPQFISEIKSKFYNIDYLVKQNVTKKLFELYG